MTIKRLSPLLFVLALLAGRAMAAPAGEVAGQVVGVTGDALAVQNAVPRVLEPGSEVLIGDILSTGADSRLEVKMLDEGVFRLGEETSFVVIDYAFDRNRPAGVMRLMSGVVDMATGTLAARDGATLRLETEFATIGIRGTKLWAGTMADGKFHVGLWRGKAITVENRAGKVTITEPGFGTSIAGPDTAPAHPHPWGEAMTRRAKAMVGNE